MSLGDIQKSAGGTRVNVTLEAMQEVGKDEQVELRAEQLESQGAMKQQMEEMVNPFAAKFASRQKEIKTHKSRIAKMAESGEKSERLLPIQQIKDMAGQFQRRNPELKANTLVLLREYIKPDDSAEDILRKIKEFYPDVTLADEALDFLLETTEGTLHQAVQEAKEEFKKNFEREIMAGRNIGTEARAAAEKGLGTPTSMRDLYRDITGNPRDSTTLFDQLSQKYAFKDLKKVVDFLLHSLGSDMKAKGSSIPRGMLHRLLTETRSLQAILGVYRFFKGRMNLVQSMFQKEGLDVPDTLTFESLAKSFMALAAERYPSSDKILAQAGRLGIEKWIQAKIIALTQLRDAIREVAMNQVYRSLQHRDELYMAIIEALEELEDELEELMGREEEEEERGKGKKKHGQQKDDDKE